MKAGCILFLEPKGTILEVVRVAKERGHYVVAIVSDASLLKSLPAPYQSAVSCIDEIHQIANWGLQEELEELANKINAKHQVCGVYFGVDACAMASAKLRLQLGLPTPSPSAMEVVLDKQKLRTCLRDAGLSTLRSFRGGDVDQWQSWELGKPAYFKPVHGSFSMYVRRCETLADIAAAKKAWKEQRDGMPEFLRQFIFSNLEYCLEEAVEGELLSVEGISSEGKFQCIGLTSRILYSKDSTVEMGSCFPYPHPLKEKIIAKVRQAHEALKFTDGPSHVELIVTSEGKIEIIDFNPRFIGADVLQSINYAYNISIEEALCDWATGKYVSFELNGNSFSCLQYILPPGKITLTSIKYPTSPEVKFQTTFIPQGTQVSNADRQIDYLGCYLTVMPEFMEAIARSKTLRVDVVINGNLQGAY